MHTKIAEKKDIYNLAIRMCMFQPGEDILHAVEVLVLVLLHAERRKKKGRNRKCPVFIAFQTAPPKVSWLIK